MSNNVWETCTGGSSASRSFFESANVTFKYCIGTVEFTTSKMDGSSRSF